MRTDELTALWTKLTEEAASTSPHTTRVYRSLGPSKTGIRASFVIEEQAIELLVEVSPTWAQMHQIPKWKGLRLKMLREQIGPRKSPQLSVTLADAKWQDIFVHFAADLTQTLHGISNARLRAELMVECIDKWNHFFRRSGPQGLSKTAQRGLFAELLFLERLLTSAVEPSIAVGAWKGCRRSYHDFDFCGTVTEVKSTLSKEPKRIWINNERQLDDRGLTNLYLYVASLHVTAAGRTLPHLICDLMGLLNAAPGTRALLNNSLTSGGYLPIHESYYPTGYVVKKEEMFSVRLGFPRIIELLGGVGDLKYSVVLGACDAYRVDADEAISRFGEFING